MANLERTKRLWPRSLISSLLLPQTTSTTCGKRSESFLPRRRRRGPGLHSLSGQPMTSFPVNRGPHPSRDLGAPVLLVCAFSPWWRFWWLGFPPDSLSRRPRSQRVTRFPPPLPETQPRAKWGRVESCFRSRSWPLSSGRGAELWV